MSVRIYEHYRFNYNYDGEVGYFPGYGSTPYLGNYAMGDTGYTWNNQVSSLYTSTYLYVFEAPNYDRSFDYALLAPGFHDLDDLQSYGIDNDTLSSFYGVI